MVSVLPSPLIPILTKSQLNYSTAILYRQHSTTTTTPSTSTLHYGEFVNERKDLDYSFHTIPTPARQALQDTIINQILDRIAPSCDIIPIDSSNTNSSNTTTTTTINTHQKEDQNWMGCSSQDSFTKNSKPLALFTAGGMGAGKGHTLRYLLRQGIVKLSSNFIWVDPDSIALSLPERPQYLAANPLTVSGLLHAEASLIQEILMGVARRKGAERTLVIDGSLTNCQWYGGLMKKFTNAGFDLEILFVYASEATMVERAKKRAAETGRVTDPAAIRRSRLKSPQCVTNLAKKEHVGRVRLFDNSAKDDPPILAYDSNLDPEWQAGQKIDVVSYVEGRSGPQIPTSPTSTQSIPVDNISKTDNVPLTKIISGGKL